MNKFLVFVLLILSFSSMATVIEKPRLSEDNFFDCQSDSDEICVHLGFSRSLGNAECGTETASMYKMPLSCRVAQFLACGVSSRCQVACGSIGKMEYYNISSIELLADGSQKKSKPRGFGHRNLYDVVTKIECE